MLVAAFSPDPDTNIVISLDSGKTWSRIALLEEPPIEDQRFYRDFSSDRYRITLKTGYPGWVDSDEGQVGHRKTGVA